MVNENIINKIEEEAKLIFKNLGPSHDWQHVERVVKTAESIAKKEKANLSIVKISAYLHDIGRIDLREENYDHAIEGAKIARKILKKYNLTKEQIENIAHCIESHRFRNNLIPKTKEAKCLHDADKIDNLGAIGIARSYIYLGETMDCVIYMKPKKEKNPNKRRTNSVQEEYEIKYKHLPNRLTTKTGRAIAKKRVKYMKSYLDQLEKEAFGKA